MQEQNIYFSLVVATLGRTSELQKFLNSVVNLTEQQFEVIIVDQNDHALLAEILTEFRSKFPILYVRSTEKNASKARNLGASLASGNWIAFPDDDCCYTPQTLANVVQEICLKKPDILSGAVLDFEHKPLLSKTNTEVEVNLNNLLGKFPEPCIFFSKKAFEMLKGFDENLGPGSPYYAGEGMDLGFRAVKEKMKIIYNPNIYVLHPRGITIFDRKTNEKVYWYSFGNGTVMVRHNRVLAYKGLLANGLKLLPRLVIHPAPKRTYFLHAIKGMYDGILKKKARLA